MTVAWPKLVKEEIVKSSWIAGTAWQWMWEHGKREARKCLLDLVLLSRGTTIFFFFERESYIPLLMFFHFRCQCNIQMERPDRQGNIWLELRREICDGDLYLKSVSERISLKPWDKWIPKKRLWTVKKSKPRTSPTGSHDSEVLNKRRKYWNSVLRFMPTQVLITVKFLKQAKQLHGFWIYHSICPQFLTHPCLFPLSHSLWVRKSLSPFSCFSVSSFLFLLCLSVWCSLFSSQDPWGNQTIWPW